VRVITDDLRVLVASNRVNVDSTVANFKEFSAAMIQLVDRIDRLVASNQANVTQGIANIRDVSQKLETTADNLNDITGRIREGKGTVGKLVESDETHKNLNDALVAVKEGVGGLNKALGTIGRDPDVVARARSAVDRSWSGRAPLDPTLADAVIKIAAAHGDAPLFDALAAAAERASDPEEHYRYLYALSDFREPPLIDRGLQLAVSPQLRSQDTAVYLSRFFANPDARSRAWAFLTAHWAALEPKIAIAGGDTNLIRSMSSFCDAASREQITSFFTAHQLPGAARTLQQTVEQINNCIGLRERQTPAVEAWLSTF